MLAALLLLASAPAFSPLAPQGGCVAPRPPGSSGSFPTPGAATPGLGNPGSAGAANAPGPSSSGGRGGPGPPVASPARAPQAPVSGSRAHAAPDEDSWTFWWKHNREAYFDTIGWTQFQPSEFITSSTPQIRNLSTKTIQEQIVPALLSALKRDPSTELKRGILLSLAKIGQREDGQLGGSELQSLIVAHLNDKNQLVAETACMALGVLDRPASLPLLANLLQDNTAGRKLLKSERVPYRMRAYAAYGVGLLGQRTQMADVQRYATHVLLKVLSEERGATPDVHTAAVIGLGLAGSGSEHIGVLLGVLANKREQTEVRAHVPAALAKLAKQADAQLRQQVLATLMDIATRRNEKAPVRQGCLLALGQVLHCGPQDASIRQKLLQVADSGKTQERGWALISLAQIGARPELGAQDPIAAFFDIQKILLKSLTRSRSTLEPWAALSIGVLAHGLRAQGERVPGSLGRALRDGLKKTNSPDLALAYGIGLGLTRDAGGLEAIQSKLAKFDVQTRAMLNTALGLQGDPAAKSSLIQELHGARHTPEALSSSAHALALLNHTSVVHELESMFRDCSCLLSASGITTALARTRHPDAVQPLLAQLGEQGATNAHRALAAVALGNLAEKDNRPWSLRISQGLNYRAHVSTLTESDYGILLLP